MDDSIILNVKVWHKILFKGQHILRGKREESYANTPTLSTVGSFVHPPMLYFIDPKMQSFHLFNWSTLQSGHDCDVIVQPMHCHTLSQLFIWLSFPGVIHTGDAKKRGGEFNCFFQMSSKRLHHELAWKFYHTHRKTEKQKSIIYNKIFT